METDLDAFGPVAGPNSAPTTAYDAFADWYDQAVQSPLFAEMVQPVVLALVGDVRGQAMLDLACGQLVIAHLPIVHAGTGDNCNDVDFTPTHRPGPIALRGIAGS